MRVAVLGAGLQGACVAMELATSGATVDLYEKTSSCVSQASAQNEGKIHLGYVYANDPSLSTARVMAKGAKAFEPLMRRWIGNAIDAVPVSKPFYYVVHRKSILSPEAVEAHFRAVNAIILELHGDLRGEYFGSDLRIPAARLSEAETDAIFDRRTTAIALRTTEIAIDPESLAAKVRDCLSHEPSINCILNAEVLRATPGSSSVRVEFRANGSVETNDYDHVVNTSWAGRLAIDQTAGVSPNRKWLYRIKHYIRMRSAQPCSVPSATMVLGPFGDTVSYDDRDLYLSWYPVGMRGSSSELSPPDWPTSFDDATSLELRGSMLQALGEIIPAVNGLNDSAIESWSIRGGVIFAWGQRDIHDPSSELHERHAIGSQSFGRYHTIDTGKLTLAPLFAQELADRIRGEG